MLRNMHFYKGLSNENFADAKKENTLTATSQRVFDTELNSILKKRDKEERLDALKDFTNSSIFKEADSNQIMAVYVALRDEGLSKI